MTRSLIILAFGILKKYIHLSIQLNVYTNKWIWIFCRVNLASYINLLTHVTYGNKIQEFFKNSLRLGQTQACEARSSAQRLGRPEQPRAIEISHVLVDTLENSFHLFFYPYFLSFIFINLSIERSFILIRNSFF